MDTAKTPSRKSLPNLDFVDADDTLVAMVKQRACENGACQLRAWSTISKVEAIPM